MRRWRARRSAWLTGRGEGLAINPLYLPCPLQSNWYAVDFATCINGRKDPQPQYPPSSPKPLLPQALTANYNSPPGHCPGRWERPGQWLKLRP
jgi:hypothetical protein